MPAGLAGAPEEEAGWTVLYLSHSPHGTTCSNATNKGSCLNLGVQFPPADLLPVWSMPPTESLGVDSSPAGGGAACLTQDPGGQ